MRIFGIDPGSERTGYGCVETDGRRHQLVSCGAITAVPSEAFPQRLARIHHELTALLTEHHPDCVAVESLFHAVNVRSALKLGHARGVAVLAAVEAGCDVFEYSPAEVKRAVVGYGRAEKHQVQQMITLLLGLRTAPTPFDASDALAVAICHLHSMPVVHDPESGARDSGLGTRRRASEPDPRVPALQSRTPSPESRIPGPKSRVPRTWRQYRPPST